MTPVDSTERSSDSTTDHIVRALENACLIVDHIEESRLGIPSVCAGWDVRAELSHLLGGIETTVRILNGGGVGHEPVSDWLGNDHRAVFRFAAGRDCAAWTRPGVLEAAVGLPFGAVSGRFAALFHLTEIVVHSCDLAVATGQEQYVDQQGATRLLKILQATDLDGFRRPGGFGAELAAPAGAKPHSQLLAFLGREIVSAQE
ncbi:TIGR03086 family metal-binding protein [Nocardia sp. NPDC047648]|uniref:TIGR03086 family metal-binding protein n=1 Tax=Nocardia sp. NPDC047648 TaxID=3155625 RepID=UPI0033E7E2AD